MAHVILNVSMPKKITYQQAKIKFESQGRTDIVLCEDSYLSFNKEAKFWDKVVGDYFLAIPKMVYLRGSVHPKRVSQKRKETCLKKYGVENPQQSKIVKDKTKTTNLKRYGNACSLHGKEIKEKVKEVFLKRYGKEFYLQSEDYKKKSKQTCLKKYGVEYFVETQNLQNIIKEKVKEKWGVENASQCSELLHKRKQTYIKNHGVSHPSFLKKKTISETGEYLEDWLERQKEPKPKYATLLKIFNGKHKIDLKQVEEVIEEFNSSKTRLEKFSEKLFESSYYNATVQNSTLLYRPDFKLSPTIFLNVDGLYWHSEQQKDRWYHFNLRKEFEEAGLRIFQFREDEIYYKPDIVKSIVDNALGKTKNKIFARKCKVEQVKQLEALKFLKENHLMGSTNAKHLGLYFNNMLVSLLSYKQRNHICKIERFCSLLDTNVVGGFSKLLNYLENNCLKPEITEIHNWVDLRYGTGSHLLNKGFYQAKETLGWKWTDFNQTYNRLKCRANMDDRRLSQQEHATELGWSKIYDAGQRLFIKTIL